MKSSLRVTTFLVTIVLLIGAAAWVEAARKSGDAWMGVYTQTVSRSQARDLGLKTSRGVLVNEVIEDSPADKAGLQEDDVILSVNGSRIEDSDELGDAVDEARPGDKMNLDILRDGKDMKLTVTLGDQSDERDATQPHMPHVYGTPRAWTFHSDGSGYIGVSLTDLTEQLGGYFGVKDGNGALISEVEEESPAAKAGLKAGDVVVGIDGEKITSSDDVREAIQDTKAGTTVSVDILRDRKPMTVKVEVDKRRGGDSYGYAFGNNQHFTVPALPHLRSDLRQLYNSDEFKAQMENLRKQMDELREELRNNDSWKEDLRKLKEDLRQLQEKSH